MCACGQEKGLQTPGSLQSNSNIKPIILSIKSVDAYAWSLLSVAFIHFRSILVSQQEAWQNNATGNREVGGQQCGAV